MADQRTLPNSVAWQNCCTSSKTAVLHGSIQAFHNVSAGQKGKL